MLENLKERLSLKHILVDANVIGRFFDYPKAFSRFHQMVEDFSSVLCINDNVYIEVVRKGRTRKQKLDIQEFLDNRFTLLPINHDTYTKAREIDQVYTFCKSIRSTNQVSIPDLINASFARIYGQNLLLMTCDHQDYPREIFERVYYEAVPTGESFSVWALYEFKNQPYDLFKEKYYSSLKAPKNVNRAK